MELKKHTPCVVNVRSKGTTKIQEQKPENLLKRFL